MNSKSGGVFACVKADCAHHGGLLPVLSAHDLIGQAQCEAIFKQLRACVGVSEAHFEVLYERFVYRYIEFVQLIPSQQGGALASLMHEGLARGLLAIEGYLANQPDKTEGDPLYLYALFTAGLLFDVHKVMTDYKITLTTEEGKFVDYWYPLEGSMVGKGEYYKLYPRQPIYQRLDRPLVLLLARDIVPELGYMWLSSDMKVYADWLDALRGEQSGGVIVEYLLTLMKWEDILARAETFEKVPVHAKVATATQQGDAFLAWLKAEIERGNIPQNSTEPGIHHVDEGVFIEHRVFQQYSDVATQGTANMNLLFLQLAEMFGEAFYANVIFRASYPQTQGLLSRFTSAFEGRNRSGVLLRDASILLTTQDAPTKSAHMQALSQTEKKLHGQLPTDRLRTYAQNPQFGHKK